MSTLRVMKPIKPTAKAPFDFEDLRYPMIGSQKLDGIRCWTPNGKALSAANKPIKNEYIRACIEAYVASITPRYSGDFLDGELIAGANIQETTSAVMSVAGQPAFEYVVFDIAFHNAPYHERLKALDSTVYTRQPPAWLRVLESCYLFTPEDSEREYNSILTYGGEGICLRDPKGLWKSGRSTLREQGLVAFKGVADSEAEVLEVLYLEHNTNAPQRNERGLLQRSTAADGQVVDTKLVGALVCRDIQGKFTGSFKIGTGFSHAERSAWALSPPIGLIARYSYQSLGSVDAPRQPRFRGFRPPEDMSETQTQ